MSRFSIHNIASPNLTRVLPMEDLSLLETIEYLNKVEDSLKTWEYYLQYPTGYDFKCMQEEGRFKPQV